MGNETSQGRNVFVLTDKPWDYDQDMRRLGLTPIYAPSSARLLEQLQQELSSGLVLEVDKVMRSSGPEREQLFQLADVFPVLRVLRRGLDREMVYLDDPDGFSTKVEAFLPREVRHSGRVPVLLHGVMASGADGDFSTPLQASILDLSDCGGFVSCNGDIGDGNQVLLRIAEMDDPTPVLAGIRWRRKNGTRARRNGMGLRFLSIRSGQLRELAVRYLGSQSGACMA